MEYEQYFIQQNKLHVDNKDQNNIEDVKISTQNTNGINP